MKERLHFWRHDKDVVQYIPCPIQYMVTTHGVRSYASLTLELNFLVFWIVTHHEVVWNWHFETTHQSYLQGSRCPSSWCCSKWRKICHTNTTKPAITHCTFSTSVQNVKPLCLKTQFVCSDHSQVMSVTQPLNSPAGAVHSAVFVCQQPGPTVQVQPGQCQTPWCLSAHWLAWLRSGCHPQHL